MVFAWDYYKDNLLSVFNIRQGGLAIYGGVLAGVLTAYIMCRIKKIPFLQFADLAAPGLLVGQILGRWGNFFNREAFGQYTDGLFAMELPLNAVRSMDDITQEMLAHARVADGVTYVQVHPTFLYESLWNLALLIFILAMTKTQEVSRRVFLLLSLLLRLGTLLDRRTAYRPVEDVGHRISGITGTGTGSDGGCPDPFCPRSAQVQTK